MPGLPTALTKTSVAGWACVAVLAAGLPGCGSSSASSTTTPAAAGTTAPAVPAAGATSPVTPTGGGPGLTRVELAAKAGAICAAATAQGRRLAAPANLTTSAAAAAAYFDKAVPPLDAETMSFQALVPAAAIAGQWEAVVGAQVALDRLAQGYRQQAHAGRLTSLADVRQLATVGQAIATAAGRLGVRCV